MKTWAQSALGDLCSMITDGKHGDCTNEDMSGFYFISAKDIRDGRISYENARQIQLQEGDIVIARTGATVGYAKRIGSLPEAAVFASYLVRVRFSGELDNMLGGVFVESPDYKAYVSQQLWRCSPAQCQRPSSRRSSDIDSASATST